MAETSAPRSIGIAVDGSETADKAFQWMLDNVVRQGDTVIGIHCAEYKNVHIGTHGMAIQAGLQDAVSVSNEMKKEEERIQTLIAHYAEILKRNETRGRIVRATNRGKPGEAIIAIAEEEKVGLLVTGTRGMGKVRRTILGSVSDYVVHHASCPVIIYRVQ